MPCNSDHLRQTPFEAQMQLAAQLAVFAAHKAGGLYVGPDIARQAENYYAEDVGQTEFLCEMLRRMPETTFNSVVYDGRDPDSRRLADWWEAHEEADRKREEAEVRAEAERRKREEVWIVKGRISGLLEEQAHLPEDTVEWQFSDGPPGERGSSEDFLSLEEGLAAYSGHILHFVGDE